MAIAISETNLKEIYALSNEDKLDLVDLIIRSMRSATNKFKSKADEHSDSWVSEFEGKWIDSKSADEMVMDLRNARTHNTGITL